MPTFSCWLSSFVSGSIRLTVPSPAFVTHTAPSATATPEGAFPTRIVSVTEPVSSARRDTTPRSGWATQRLPNPIALAPGRWPSSPVSWTLPSSALIRATEFVPISTSASPPDLSRGIEIATSAKMTTIAPISTRGRRVFVGGGAGGPNGCSRSTGSAPSGTTRATATGSEMPLNVSEPRSS